MSSGRVEQQSRAKKKLHCFDGLQRKEKWTAQEMVPELVVCCPMHSPIYFGKKPLLPKVFCTSQALCHEFFPHNTCFFRDGSCKSSSEWVVLYFKSSTRQKFPVPNYSRHTMGRRMFFLIWFGLSPVRLLFINENRDIRAGFQWVQHV